MLGGGRDGLAGWERGIGLGGLGPHQLWEQAQNLTLVLAEPEDLAHRRKGCTTCLRGARPQRCV